MTALTTARLAHEQLLPFDGLHGIDGSATSASTSARASCRS
jgi:hypothetical protein